MRKIVLYISLENQNMKMGVIHYSNMSKLLQKANHLHLHSTLDSRGVQFGTKFFCQLLRPGG